MSVSVAKKFLVECAVCGKEIKTNIKRHKFCSNQCRSKNAKREYEKNKSKYSIKYFKWRCDIFMRDDFKCQYCGLDAQSGAVLHVDHIKPISKKGGVKSNNLITICSNCNLGKGDVLLKEYQEKKFKKIAGGNYEFNKKFEKKWNDQMENIKKYRCELANNSHVGKGGV